MTKKENALKKSLDNWEKYVLKQFRNRNTNSIFLREVDRIVQDGSFQKFYITIEGDKKQKCIAILCLICVQV